MGPAHAQKNTARCPTCRAENYPFASFCISCGEPLESGSEPSPAPEVVPVPVIRERESKGISSPGGLGRRETIIGVLLLMAAVGFALYQWHRSDEQASAYRQGIAAEQSKDWDSAAEAFARAGDQVGAVARARNARTLVGQRDSLYLQGISAQDRSDWKTAAQAFEGVLRIQPAYQDSRQRLEQVLAHGTLSADMEGLVMRLNGASDEGLYYLDGAGDRLALPGSDRSSAVRAISPQGTSLVYDRPTARAGAAAGGQSPVSSIAGEREAVLATIDGSTVRSRSLVGVNPAGSGTFTPSGLWWTLLSGGQHRTWYINNLSRPSAPVELTNLPGNRSTVAFDPLHSRVVWSAPVTESSTGREQAVVTMTDAQGDMPWLVGTLYGSIEEASISRDGLWLLLISREQNLDGSEQKTVWAQSLGISWDPRYGEVTGERIKLASVQVRPGSGARISAVILPSPAPPVKVVVDLLENGLENLTIYTLETNQADQVWYYDPSRPQALDSAAFSSGAGMLASPRRYSQDTVLELYDLDRPNFQHWFNVPLPLGEDQPARVEFAPRGDYILATLKKYTGIITAGTQEIYAAPLGNGGSLNMPRLIASGPLSAYPTAALAPGDALLAYISAAEELHVVHLDGTGDTLVAPGADAVWSLGAEMGLPWAR